MCSECELWDPQSRWENQILLQWKLKSNKAEGLQAPLYFVPLKEQQQQNPIWIIHFNSNEGYSPDQCIDMEFMIYGIGMNVKLI